MRSNLRPSARAIDWPSDVLPTPGGPTKHRIEPRASGLSLPHGEELEDAVLDLLDVVVVGVEHLARVREVEVVLGRLVPRQRRDPLEVGADDAVLGRGLRQLLQPRELAVGLLAHRPRAARSRASCSRSSSTSASAGSRSPSSSWIALSCWRRTYSRWDLSSSDCTCDWIREPIADDLELAREDLGEPPQPLGDVALLEQLLLLLGLDPQRAGDQVRERGRVVEVGDRHLQLLRQVRDLLDDARERLLHVAHQRRQLRALVDARRAPRTTRATR